jgi:hypothetical protein
MRIGFASVYSWRPHVEHLYFLARLAARAGCETRFVTCDADLPACYTRELRNRPAWQECLQCRAGGVRSYAGAHVTTLAWPPGIARPATQRAAEWAASSASTLGRFESDADYRGKDFENIAGRLTPAVDQAFAAAREWIRREKLDAVCVFNGRMDATRAIAEAASAENINYVSVERTWFGDGLQLLPNESCLGLRTVHEQMRQWRDAPLTRLQAQRAAAHVARRFLRTNVKEWRAYNANARAVKWPGGAAARRKILLIPSSRNEVWGHPDWDSEWQEPTAAYDALIARFALEPHEITLRCHPNWAENIGKHTGVLAERYYTEWARQRGIPVIAAADTASTMTLVEQCDAIVIASGSAALEAGVLGKQVISIGPALYQEAGLRNSAYTPAEVRVLKLHCEMPAAERQTVARSIARQTLRFCHTAVYRIPQYTKEVRSQSTTRYEYDLAADPDRFIELLATGKLRADDPATAPDSLGEDEILAAIERHDWASLVVFAQQPEERFSKLRRRLAYRPIDWIGNRKSVGDR